MKGSVVHQLVFILFGNIAQKTLKPKALDTLDDSFYRRGSGAMFRDPFLFGATGQAAT